MLNLSEENDFQAPPPPPHLRGGEGGESSHNPPQTQPQPTPPIYRWRVIGRCPCCRTAWVLDIDATDDPVASWPSPGKMTDALLCGSCQARKRVLFRGRDGRTVSLWTSNDVGVMLRNIEDPSQDFVPTVKRSAGEVPQDAPAPRDQIEDILSRFRRFSVVGEDFVRSTGVQWDGYIARAKAERKQPKQDGEQ